MNGSDASAHSHKEVMKHLQKLYQYYQSTEVQNQDFIDGDYCYFACTYALGPKERKIRLDFHVRTCSLLKKERGYFAFNEEVA